MALRLTALLVLLLAALVVTDVAVFHDSTPPPPVFYDGTPPPPIEALPIQS